MPSLLFPADPVAVALAAAEIAVTFARAALACAEPRAWSDGGATSFLVARAEDLAALDALLTQVESAQSAAAAHHRATAAFALALGSPSGTAALGPTGGLGSSGQHPLLGPPSPPAWAARPDLFPGLAPTGGRG
ncbi:hypothetical protein [Miniimonas sp. S16]|uniref:hypothetical protein n=1 Tax=Miniimonas sp. S16 TaxID=2171623 RepID=UPI000D527CF0|nr:hypothetical protein [Miniimonas sp. S16]